MQTPISERFWPKVMKSDACWIWTAAKNNRGYGFVGVGRKMALAHRVAWQLTHGPIESGLFVLHRCDNPPCVRPDHLFLGTAKDNTSDMVSKGRARGGSSPGESNPSAKLTNDNIASIRRMFAGGASQCSLARTFGVSQSTIWRAVRLKTFAAKLDLALVTQ